MTDNEVVIVLTASDCDGDHFIALLVIPKNMNVNQEEKLYEKSRSKKSFKTWLIAHGGREATDDEAYIYYTDY